MSKVNNIYIEKSKSLWAFRDNSSGYMTTQKPFLLTFKNIDALNSMLLYLMGNQQWIHIKSFKRHGHKFHDLPKLEFNWKCDTKNLELQQIIIYTI